MANEAPCGKPQGIKSGILFHPPSFVEDKTVRGVLISHSSPHQAAGFSAKKYKMSAQDFAEKLRKGNPPVFTRIKNNQVMMDLRTIQDGEEEEIAGVLKDILNNGKNNEF